MATAEAVARYFLHLAAGAPEPTPVTQMQLHKLLYYAQGWSLGARGEPLFAGRIEAWMHGPVVREAYRLFARFEDEPIPAAEAGDGREMRPEDRTLVEWVWRGYGRFAAWHLRDMTHREAPWREARGTTPETERSEAPIGEESMRRYFVGLHERACRRSGLDPERLAAAMADARAGRTVALADIGADPARGVAD